MNVNDFYKTTNYNELYLQLLQGIKEGVGDFNTENIALLTEKLSAVVNTKLSFLKEPSPNIEPKR